MTTTTPTLDERITTRRATLTKALAARKDPLDLPPMTQREENAYVAETAKIDAKIATLNTTVATYAALPSLDTEIAWLGFLQSSRKTIDAEILAMPPRIRNEKELEQQQRLVWSMRLIDFGFGIAVHLPIVDLSSTRIGELMAAAGYATSGPELRGPRGWQGPIKETETRIKHLTAQRATAQAALDVVLLDDTERAKHDAASAARRAVLDSLHLKMNSTGTGYVPCDEYGDVRDPATLTPEQRDTLDRENATEAARAAARRPPVETT